MHVTFRNFIRKEARAFARASLALCSNSYFCAGAETVRARFFLAALVLFCGVVPVPLLGRFKYGTYNTDPPFDDVPVGVVADIGLASGFVESEGIPVLD